MKRRDNKAIDSHSSEHISIIGGSSAGFFTAYLLASQGLPVQVFEEKKDEHQSKRTLIVTNHIQSLIKGLYKEAIVNRINCFELFTDGHYATIPLQRPDLVIESSKLNQILRERAEKHGAKTFFGHSFMNFHSKGRKLNLIISCNDGRELTQKSTTVLIGADGAFSKVAKCAGWPQPDTAPLMQAIVKLPNDLPPNTVRVWFVPSDTPYFYWLIPHSQKEGVLGLTATDEESGRKSLERFLEKKCLSPIDFQSARIPIYSRWVPFYRQTRGGHVYLVGDAVGHVKVTTVGGMVTGLKGALGVAEAILNGGTSRKLQILKRELNRHKFIRELLNEYTEDDYSRLLSLLSPLVKKSLGRFSRDETNKLFMDLFLRQPHLMFFVFRHILHKIKTLSGL